jgi:hypothetical protein
MQFRSALALLALVAGCGLDDDADYFADITEPVCWKESGQLYVQSFVPEGVEPDPEFEQMCMNLGKLVEE